jgi:hypothetical protein
MIVEALARLRSRSCIIDGEAVCCDDKGVPNFNSLRYRRHDASVFLYAFDLIELDGDDLRREPLDIRKATLASLLKRAPGLRLNEHIEADGQPRSSTPARWAWRGSCRSARLRASVPAAHRTGSRRTRHLPRLRGPRYSHKLLPFPSAASGHRLGAYLRHQK